MAKGMRNTYMYSMLTKTGLQNRKAQFAADAAKAMEEYLAEPEAVRIRTIRLRAQRLERDAAVADAEAAGQAKKVLAIKKKMTFPYFSILTSRSSTGTTRGRHQYNEG